MSHVEVEYEYEALPENSSLAASLMAGALAGVAEHAVMYPVDSIKTRMQILQPTPQAVYSGVINAASRITTTEGARTLWRGVNSVIMGAGPAHALHFATYEFAKESFGGNATGHHLVAAAAAGACATIAHDALMNPFDVIKQRMQVHGSVYRSVVECASKVYRAEGLRAFYISYPTTLTMTIPFQSIQFATYEYLRKVLNPSGNYDPMTHVMAGGVSGAVAAAATTPLDVAKTLLQTRGESKDVRIRNCNGLFEAGRLIYQRQGLAGFAKGLQPRILGNMPSTAISWSVYEYGKFLLNRENLDKQPIMA
ncbi:putative MRS4-protein of the mitochondrial carrier family [Dissophora ornata]|nr:Fe(2+) transporter [Dissophora ornata]KAI8602395.1 putative MRS4-protein of the mitochondrial carrier family [Dissophora ornata]